MGAGEVTDMKQTRTRALFATFLKLERLPWRRLCHGVALLEHEFVEEKQWVTREEFWTWWPLRNLPPALWR